MSGHQSWAVLCRYRCRLLLAEIPKGVDRNSELKQRLHLWETGQISDLICKVLGSRILDRFAEQQGGFSQRGRRAALTARGSVSKAVTGLVLRSAQRTATGIEPQSWRARQTGAGRDEAAGTEQNRSWSYW